MSFLSWYEDGESCRKAGNTEARSCTRNTEGTMKSLCSPCLLCVLCVPLWSGEHQIVGFGRHPVSVLAFPLDMAANRVGQRHTNWLASQIFFPRPHQIVHYSFGGVARVIHPTTGVDQLAVANCHSAPRVPGGSLRRRVCYRPAEQMLRSKQPHAA